MSPWLNLSPGEFEEFCYRLLELNGFKNLSWHGVRGADRGRDIVCAKADKPLPGIERLRTWLVQCKHYKRTKLSKATIQEWLAASREHKPDTVLLIVSRSLSSAMKDWLSAVSSEYPFDVLLWEDTELRNQYWKHGAKLRKFFPTLPKVNGKVTFYEVEGNEREIMCNDFEIAFRVYNSPSRTDALKQVAEFIEFIKANDIQFYNKRP